MEGPTIIELEHLLGNLGLETPVPSFSSADVLAKPVDIYRSYLASLLGPVLDADPGNIYEAIHSTSDVSLGDLAVILPKLRIGEAEMSNLPSALKTKLPSTPLFPAPFIDGVHLRFLFNPKTLPRLLLSYIRDRGTAYGNEPSHGLRDLKDPSAGRKKVVVEFSSPNLAKQFNDEHLRSTFLGAFVSNLYTCMGWDVVRLNYLGDWGKDVALLGVGWAKFGSEAKLQEEGVEHLLDVYEKIKEEFKPEEDARKRAKKEGLSTADIEAQGVFAEREGLFKNLEDGEEGAVTMWRRFRDLTIADLSAAYERLSIKFDDYSGESKVKPETMAEAEAVLKEKGVLEESEGSWIIDFSKHTSRRGLGIGIVRQRTGSTTYMLRDIAAILDREAAYGFDKMIYVVSAKQDNHLQQVFTSLELMGRSDLRDKVEHVSFAKIQGLSQNMKSVRRLGAILDKTADLMREAMTAELGSEGINGHAAAVTDLTAVSALLAQDMSGKRGHSSPFDPKRMTSYETDTGVKIQLWHARLAGTIRDLQAADIDDVEMDYDSLGDPDSANLLRIMAQYPDITASTIATIKALEPHSILSYIYRLVYAVQYCISPEDNDDENDEHEGDKMNAITVEEPSPGVKRAKLVLYETARQVLENGMRLVGIPTLGMS